jgi:hypothetical protein
MAQRRSFAIVFAAVLVIGTAWAPTVVASVDGTTDAQDSATVTLQLENVTVEELQLANVTVENATIEELTVEQATVEDGAAALGDNDTNVTDNETGASDGETMVVSNVTFEELSL